MVEQRERKIYIKELILDIFAKWKLVLVGAIIVSVLFTIVKYNSDIELYEQQNAANSETIDINSFSYEEKKMITNYMYLYDYAEYYEEYSENAYIMKLDPYNVEKIKLQYVVDSEYTFDFSDKNKNDYTDTLVMIYKDYMMSGDFAKAIASDMNPNFVLELINVTENIDGNAISLSVIVPEGTNSTDIIKNIENTLADVAEEKQQYGAHKLVKVNESKTVGYDNEVALKKYTVKKSISDVKEQAIILSGKLSGKQIDYIKQLQGITEKKEQAVKPTFNAKNVVVGFVLGIILMVCYYVVASILSGKLQNMDDIRVMFGINVLGTINTTKKAYEYEKKLSYMASRIKVVCRKESIDKLYITSSCMAKIDNKVLVDIVETLKKDIKDVSCIGDLCIEPVALEKAKEMDNVIILEKIGVSHYEDIAEQIKIITENEINIIGAIAIK